MNRNTQLREKKKLLLLIPRSMVSLIACRMVAMFKPGLNLHMWFWFARSDGETNRITYKIVMQLNSECGYAR